MTDFRNIIDNYFGITARGSTIRTEVYGGLITFLAMLYILVINPMILGDNSQMVSREALFTATALSAVIACILTGIYAKFPVAMAPSMGVNAFISYTVVDSMGFTYSQALMAVFLSGLMFFFISVTGYRKKLVQAIPASFRFAITVGIGFYIAFIGLNNAGLINVGPNGGLAFPTEFNLNVGLGFFSILLTAILFFRKNWMAAFVGILATCILGIVLGEIYLPPEYITVPDFSLIGSVFLDFTMFDTPMIPSFLVTVLSLFIIDTFDSTGTLLAVGERTGTITEEGFNEGAGRALLTDSGASMIGSILGTSTASSFVESQAGIEEGARTGLMAVVVGLLFLVALFFGPVFTVITPACVTGALVLVGILMIGSVHEIDWSDHVISVMCFLTIVIMCISSSISTGIGFGALSYVIGMCVTKRYKEVSKGMWIIALLFAVYFPLYYVIIPGI